MRILHLISGADSRAGGPAMAMAGMCKAQRTAGLEIAALATWRQGQGRDIADDLSASQITVTLVGPAHGPLSNHPQLPPALRAAIGAADVVHAHGVWEQIQHAAADICRTLGKPYVISSHGMLSPWSLSQKWLKKKFYMMLRLRRDLNGAAAMHFTSIAERDAAAALKLAPPAIVEPLGVDLTEFQSLPASGTFRDRFPAIGGRKIALFLGRLYPGKGVEYLIPALARCRTKDTMVVAVGPDSNGFMAAMQKLAVEHGVGDRVLFTGMQRGRERIEALVDADVFAIPSEHENFGIVVVEALACGTEVIVSDGVALHSEVTKADVGSSVRVGDIDALAAELDRRLAQSAKSDADQQRARAFAFDKFDWTKIASRWRDHYAGLKVH